MEFLTFWPQAPRANLILVIDPKVDFSLASGLSQNVRAAARRSFAETRAALVLGNDIAVRRGHRLQLCQQCLRRCWVRSDILAIKGRPACRTVSSAAIQASPSLPTSRYWWALREHSMASNGAWMSTIFLKCKSGNKMENL